MSNACVDVSSCEARTGRLFSRNDFRDKGVDIFAVNKAAAKLLERVVELEKQTRTAQYPNGDTNVCGTTDTTAVKDSTPVIRPKNAPLPKEHWVYCMMHQLQQRGMLAGYPDDAFTGKQIFINYGFSAALFRVILYITQERGRYTLRNPHKD